MIERRERREREERRERIETRENRKWSEKKRDGRRIRSRKILFS